MKKRLSDLQFRPEQSQLKDIFNGLTDMRKMLVHMSVEKLATIKNSKHVIDDIIKAAQTSELNELIQAEINNLKEEATIHASMVKEANEELNGMAEEMLKEYQDMVKDSGK